MWLGLCSSIIGYREADAWEPGPSPAWTPSLSPQTISCRPLAFLTLLWGGVLSGTPYSVRSENAGS